MSNTDSHCCYACVDDPFLSARIKSEGVIAECTQCDTEREAITEFDLSQWIEAVLQNHYEPGDGESVAEIIEQIAGVTEAFAQQIADELASIAGYVESGGETFYDSDEGYVVSRFRPDQSDQKWSRFTESVRSEARFFNRASEEWLDHIFGSLSEDRTWHGKEVFKTYDIGAGFYRARHVPDIGSAFKILENAALLLGPLPYGKGSSGRMNAAGVSVFYGALDEETCLAEIRPPVGSTVLSARFDLLRPMRLLDFDLLETVQARCSHFDSDYDAKQERAAFLRALGLRIAAPVMPDDEAFGYLPTQIVADYLAQRPEPPIDGLLFRSTQTGGKGRNVVLFHQSSRVEVGAVDGTIAMHPFSGASHSTLEDPFGDAPTPIEPDPFPIDIDDSRDPALRIAPDSIQVTTINRVRYDENWMSVDLWLLDIEERERNSEDY